MAAARRFLVFFALCGCGALTGCGQSNDPPAGETAGEEASTAPADDDADPSTDPGTSSTDPGTSSTPMTSSGPSSSESGIGAGCMTSADCADGEFCDFADDSCGVSGMQGACAPIVEGCADTDRPVCACGDELHANICAASAAGVDVSFVGACPLADPLAFRCGYTFCISGDEYCLAQAGAMPTAECIALPPVCVPADCSCITNCCDCDNATCCSEYCINDGGDLTYTCP